LRKTGIFLWLILCSIFLGSCEITDDGNYLALINNYERIAETLNLKSINQIDEIAKVNLTRPGGHLLTSEFKFSTFQIKLNTDTVSFTPTIF
jgi:hypothetical protein